MHKQKRNIIKHKIPVVRGYIKRNVILSKQTWFRVGGPAELFFKPADEIDLIKF